MNFQRKILLYDNLVLKPNSFFLFLLLQVWCFYVFSHFPSYFPWFNQEMSYSLAWNIFYGIIFSFFLNLIVILIYGFGQTFRLNLVTWWTFFSTNSRFNAYVKFLIWITYSFLSCKLAASFSTFSIFIFFGKNGKLLWISCFQCFQLLRILSINFKKISFITIFITAFHEIFINLKVCFPPI